MKTDPRAGTLESPQEKLDVAALTAAFFDRKPDPENPAQRVSFGTSGHRGSAFDTAFNEDHILAITQAICDYRKGAGIDGPLFLGRDTHAVSEPAFHVALDVLAANGVTAMTDAAGGYTPTPAISHAIITYNKGREDGLADGIVITPSHNPPQDGGFKYNPPHGGPAEGEITGVIERAANDYLRGKLAGVKRQAGGAGRPHDYIGGYVGDLGNIIRLDAIAKAGLKLFADALGGAGAAYWQPIAERYGLDITANTQIDPTFASVPRDWDGNIRMDCSSPYPMRRVLANKDKFDLCFANDTDADRHGIVTQAGLMAPNDYLAAMAWYLATTRDFAGKGIGKTVVSSSNIDKVAKKTGMSLYEVPVGFKWFVQGLSDGTLYFSGEESAGASFLRRNGQTWTTDKDGLIAVLLAAEMLATTGKSPAQLFAGLEQDFGRAFYARIDNPADQAFRTKLAKVKAEDVTAATLGGDAVTAKFTQAPGNKAAIGGIKLVTDKGWIAARPSGTEDIYKVYAESFVSADHLKALQSDVKAILSKL